MILHISDIPIFDHFWNLPKMHQFSEMCEKRAKSRFSQNPRFWRVDVFLAQKQGFGGPYRVSKQ